MRTIKTYRKVGALYIACEADFTTPIQLFVKKSTEDNFRVADRLGVITRSSKKSSSGGKICLLLPEGYNRIDEHCSSGGNEGSQQCYYYENDCDD
jgi:hypothetical protein